MAQVAEQFAQQSGPAAELCLILGPLKTSSFLGYLLNEPEYDIH